MTRRLQSIPVEGWATPILIALLGIFVMIIGGACQVIQLVVSIRHRDELRDTTGDPWDGRSLEWSTPSPPPAFNFPHLPHVEDAEPYWSIKQRAIEGQIPLEPLEYQAIEMPKNSPTGFVTSFFATLIGFALIWHIWWLALVGVLGAYVTFVVFAWRDQGEYEIPAEEVERVDRTRLEARRAWYQRREQVA